MSEPHAVAAEEYRETIGLIDEVFRLSRGLPGTVLPEVPVVLGAANRSRMIVISELGRVVSHAAYQPQRNQTPPGEYSLGALSCVVTDEQFRGRGFASDLVRHLDGMMAGEGLDAAILWAIEPAFYRRLGYEEAGEEFSFDLSPELFRPARYPGDVRRFASADVPAMHRLQREKPHKVARAAEVFDALMNCPKERIYVAESGGRVAAYAVAGKGEDFPDFVVDWAGETPGVIACIAAALEGRTERLKIRLPEAESELAGELTDLGFAVTTRKAGMVKILNLGSLLAATCRELSGSQREETFTLSADGEEFTSDDPAVIARLVFGPEGAGELIGAAPEKVLAACEAELPLPLHVPLLDHV